jgi:hypothetical protein
LHLPFCCPAVSFGQINNSSTGIENFHVHGTVIGPLGNDVVPRAKVTFQNENKTETVLADNRGQYDVDLPVGLYTMKVHINTS